MLDFRRPTSVPPSGADGSLLTDVVIVAGAVAGFYLAAYLYEIGFLWRLGLPVALAEIGFSRSLAAVALAAPAGCFVAGCAMRLRLVAAGGAPGGAMLAPNAAHAAIVLAALTVGIAVLVPEASRRHFADGALAAYRSADIGILRSLVFLGGILVLALYQRHAAALLGRAEWGRSALSSFLLLLLLALPVGLGWHGAGLKESRSASFLYLAGSDFALVRLYTDKAVFLRYDGQGGKFGSEYRVRHFALGEEARIAGSLEIR